MSGRNVTGNWTSVLFLTWQRSAHLGMTVLEQSTRDRNGLQLAAFDKWPTAEIRRTGGSGQFGRGANEAQRVSVRVTHREATIAEEA
jgi:hypothetical protein